MKEKIMKALECKMVRNDARAKTVKGYLKALLRTLWEEEEAFSGKRPFGNSSWKWEVYGSWSKYGILKMEFDEDGFTKSSSYDAADKLIHACIDAL